jgi:hypothetical protein
MAQGPIREDRALSSDKVDLILSDRAILMAAADELEEEVRAARIYSESKARPVRRAAALSSLSQHAKTTSSSRSRIASADAR